MVSMVVKERSIRHWVQLFKNGRVNVHDDERPGRPADARSTETLTALLYHLEQDRRLTIAELQRRLADNNAPDVSRSTICRLLREAGFCKVCARWVPRDLTEEHKQQRMYAAETFLVRYADDPGMLERIRFSYLKVWLGSIRFSSDEELVKNVLQYFRDLDGDYYKTGMLKLPKRYQKCMNVFGDYVEK